MQIAQPQTSPGATETRLRPSPPELASAASAAGQGGEIERYALGELSGVEDAGLTVENATAQLIFGRAKLAADRAGLVDGEILALDEDVEAPVELTIGDRIIAFGELVKREGQMGIRITRLAGSEVAGVA